MPKPQPLSFTRARPAYEKGRAARSNASGRYEMERRSKIDVGWNSLTDDFAKGRRTEVHYETPRKIITYNTSPDLGFDRSINPYRGCEHGCIYCFARPMHAYMGLSPGIDFETQLYAKPNAAKLLAKELSNPRYKVRSIAIGTNTDAYQPIERTHRIMREVLQVLSDFNHPVTVLTKSDLILRDIDILAPMAARGLTRTMLSITTQDRALARAMEPRASTPENRFAAIKTMAEAGISTGVMVGPVIPGLNDSELETILERAHNDGAESSGYTILRMPLEVSPLFQEWLNVFSPNRAARILRHIRGINGGKDYDPNWSRNGRIRTPFAKLIDQRFKRVKRKLGSLDARDRKPLRTDLFRIPSAVSGQGDLFE